MKKVFIIGATSAIAHETAKFFASTGAWLFLAGRNQEKLIAVADDLRVRGASKVEIFPFDMNCLDRHAELVSAATKSLDGLDIVLIAHGTLPDQRLCEKSVEETMKELTTNCLSVISLLTHLKSYFEQQEHGCIAVITSVAGDRGKQSNYIYGAAKGAVSIYLQGLRNRLYKFDVAVVTIKPGFVNTPMTAAQPKNFLYVNANVVGKKIYEAIIKGKDVVYIPWFWRWIMFCIRLLPEPLFKRMNL
ncbi:MAG: SDR family oxidoreductase [bacterium]